MVVTSILQILLYSVLYVLFLFFFNDTATTEIYTLSLHDALPIWNRLLEEDDPAGVVDLVVHEPVQALRGHGALRVLQRSEEHTSELQSHSDLVCRLLLEKKKKNV